MGLGAIPYSVTDNSGAGSFRKGAASIGLYAKSF